MSGAGGYYDHHDTDPFEPVAEDEEDEDDAGDDFDFGEVIDDLSEVWEADETEDLQGEAGRVEVPSLPRRESPSEACRERAGETGGRDSVPAS